MTEQEVAGKKQNIYVLSRRTSIKIRLYWR